MSSIKSKTYEGKLAAIAVAGPFGAVKEQAAGLYAEELASRGFAAMAFDPSFIGESGGAVRNVASPDINTEDFCAAVDYLTVQDFIDPEKIGILGICGFGGMAINAAAMDTRIKATVASTMVPIKGRVEWLTCCRRMRRFLSRIITITTKQNAAIQSGV